MPKRLYVLMSLLMLILLTLFLVFVVFNTKRMQAVAVLQEDHKKTIHALEERSRVLEGQRTEEEMRTRELQTALSEMTARHKMERNLIQELWRLLLNRTSVSGTNNLAQTPTPKYDGDAIKKMASESGGDLSAVLRKVLTEAGLRSTLEQHASEPDYWVAYASLLEDKSAALKQLEQAALLYPDSPPILLALVKARVAAQQYDDSTLAYLEQLKRTDAGNAWTDFYEAHVLFRRGQVQEALRCLASAQARPECADNAIETLVARHHFLLDEGCSNPAALGLSVFTYDFPQLAMLNHLSEDVQEQVKSLSASGRQDDALQLAETLMYMGHRVSAAGPFIVYDRVGTTLFRSGLLAQKSVYEAMEQAELAREAELKLQALQVRASLIEGLVASFGKTLPSMSVEDLAVYIENAMADGEFSALQALPGVAHDLEHSLP